MTDDESRATPEAALHRYMESFGIPAYAATATPSDAEFPYLTYELVLGEWDSGELNVPVNLWFRTDGEAEPNAKVREMFESIGRGGRLLECRGGVLWVKRGSPWAQAVRVEGEDEKVKRRYVNVNIEYLVNG